MEPGFVTRTGGRRAALAPPVRFRLVLGLQDGEQLFELAFVFLEFHAAIFHPGRKRRNPSRRQRVLRRLFG
jgi:hypothetical protein